MPAGEAERREARARGRVAVSSILSGAGALGGAALAIALSARSAAARLALLAREAFAGTVPVGGVASRLARDLAYVTLPVALAALAGALVVGLVQSGALFAPGALGQRTGNERSGRTLSLALATATIVLGLDVARTVGAAIAAAPTLDGVKVAAAQAISSLAGRALLLVLAAGLGDWAWRRVRLDARLGGPEPVRRRGDDDEPDPRVRAEQSRRRQI